MQYIQVYYISLSGNTTDFLKRVNQYICANYGMELNIVNIKDKVKDGESIYFQATEPYFSFLPAYLEGGEWFRYRFYRNFDDSSERVYCL